MAPRTTAALRLAAGVLVLAAVASAFGPLPAKRDDCTLSQTLPQCGLSGVDDNGDPAPNLCTTVAGAFDNGQAGVCGLCYYCNPGVGQDDFADAGPNPEFSLTKCKAAASAVLKNAIACEAKGKAQSVGCQNNGYSKSCKLRDSITDTTTGSSALPEGSFFFEEGSCYISSETCVSTCNTCNPASPCFDLDLCKWIVSGVLNEAALYNSQSCICSGTTA